MGSGRELGGARGGPSALTPTTALFWDNICSTSIFVGSHGFVLFDWSRVRFSLRYRLRAICFGSTTISTRIA